jgi:hypothetical protein
MESDCPGTVESGHGAYAATVRSVEEDLARLPADVQAAARRQGQAGEEVDWPNDRAAEAINALCDLGLLITGLDARVYPQSGGVMEFPASVFEADRRRDWDHEVERSRSAALKALPSTKEMGDFVLVGWLSKEDLRELDESRA